jgi:predicted RecA/RadA family phage recombinase
MKTAGSRTLTATDTVTATIIGTSGTVTVTVAVATSLSTTQTGSFTQADLTGVWNFFRLNSGPDVVAGTVPGWMRGTVTIDANGNATITSLNSSLGPLTPPPAGTIFDEISEDGVIAESGIYGLGPFSQTVMSSNKLMTVGTASFNSMTRSLQIAVKQVPGVTFSSADIRSVPCVFSNLGTGAVKGWTFETGMLNAAQQITFNSIISDNGVQTPPPANSITLAITSDGIVTRSDTTSVSSYQGVMTPDKKLIIATFSIGNSHRLEITALGGQTFTTADLAGNWRVHGITSETAPMWQYSISSFTSTGVGTQLYFLDSNFNTGLNAPFTLSVDPTGNITKANDSSFLGVMSFGKNFIVHTADTLGSGLFGMEIAVK